MKPISPHEVVGKKKSLLPDEVLDAFNELIAEHFSGRSSKFEQSKVIDRILEKFHHKLEKDELFKNHWLDVEDVYRESGWIVEYDKPGYNESYAATFKFSVKH